MKSTLLIVVIVATATSLLLGACVALPAATPEPMPAAGAVRGTPCRGQETATPVAEAAPVEAGVIPVEALRNATYSGIYDEPITLTDGSYEGKPAGEGDASRPMVQYADNAELTGDLDGDGVADAVVFLVERGGGSGAFTYVAAQLNRAGQPLDAGAVWIEDRIQVKSAAIAEGQVTLEIITHGPGDPACCSTHQARKTYALQEGKLVETTPQGGDLVKVSAADLDGTSWTLAELKDGQPALADAAVTINFEDARPDQRLRRLQQLHRQLQPGRDQPVHHDHRPGGRHAASLPRSRRCSRNRLLHRVGERQPVGLRVRPAGPLLPGRQRRARPAAVRSAAGTLTDTVANRRPDIERFVFGEIHS